MNRFSNELTGYIPFKKLKNEILNKYSLIDGIYSFVRIQDCLIKGKSSLNKLNSFFKDIKLDENMNHIFILADNVYLIFKNVGDHEIYYIYNEFAFKITKDFSSKKAMNIDNCYFAFNFLNENLNGIKDYFLNHLEQDKPTIPKEDTTIFSNIIYSNTKRYISPHNFKPIMTDYYFKLLSETFYSAKQYSFEIFYKPKENYIIETETIGRKSLTLLFEFANGMFSLTARISQVNDNGIAYDTDMVLASPSKSNIVTIFPIDEVYRYNPMYSSERLATLSKLFDTFNVKKLVDDKFLPKLNKNKLI